MSSKIIMSDYPNAISHLVVIDSRDRNYTLYPKENNYTIELPQVYKNVFKVKLRSIELPTSFYVFDAVHKNTSMFVRIWDVSNTMLEQEAQITIPDGNYSVYLMETEIAKELNAAFEPLTFEVRVNRISGGIDIKSQQGRYIEIDTSIGVKDTVTDWGLAYFLGFKKNTVYRDIFIKSPGIVKLLPFTYVFMNIDEINSIDECNIYGDEGGQINNAFAKIPISVTSFDYIFRDEKCCIYNKTKLNPPIGKLFKLSINWRFHDGALVDFHGVEHSFSIELICDAAHTIPTKNLNAMFEMARENKKIEEKLEGVMNVCG